MSTRRIAPTLKRVQVGPQICRVEASSAETRRPQAQSMHVSGLAEALYPTFAQFQNVTCGWRCPPRWFPAQGRRAVGRNSTSRIAPGLGDIQALFTPVRRTERLQVKRRNTPEVGYCALRFGVTCSASHGRSTPSVCRSATARRVLARRTRPHKCRSCAQAKGGHLYFRKKGRFELARYRPPPVFLNPPSEFA